MRCLLVADLHYALKQYDWLISVAPEFDVVIVAGDHLDLSSHVDGRAQIVVVLKYLQRLRTLATLITCSGNHDLDGRNQQGEKAATWFAQVRGLGIAADGDSLVVGDTLFTICPWWDGPIARRSVGEHLARDAARRTGKWAWVYHAPPSNSPTSWDGRRSFGDVELAGWIREYRPDLVFCGHVHTSPFCPGGSWVDRIGPTWVFNAGYQIGPTPACVILDTEEAAALWLSTTLIEAVDLAAPSSTLPRRLTEVPAWLKASDQILGLSPG